LLRQALVADNKFSTAPVTDDLLENLQTFVGAAAVAIDKNRLLEKTHSAHTQMSALFGASKALVLPSLEDVAQTTLAATGADSISIILIHDERATALVSRGTEKGMNVQDVIRPHGISVQVMRSGIAERIEETRGQEYRLNPWIYKDGTRSALCLPLRVEGVAIGVMWIHHLKPRTFSDPEVEALQLYVNQAAVAYDRARKVHELEAFQTAVERITASGEYAEVIDAIVAAIQELLKADAVTIWPYDEALNKFISDKVHMTGFKGLKNEALPEPRRGRTTYAVLDQSYLAVDDLSTFRSDFFQPPHVFLKHHQIASFQAVVLTAGREKVGVVYANYRTSRYFTEDDRRLLMRLAPYAGLALKKSLLKGQVARVESAASAFVDLIAIRDLGRTLNAVAKGLQKATACDAVVLYTYDDSTKTIGYPPTMIGVNEPNKARRYEIPVNSLIYELVRSDKPVIVERVMEHAFGERRFAKEEGIRSAIATPLRADDRKVGVVFVNYRQEHRFTEADLKTINLFANQAAAAIRNAQLIGASNQQKVLDWACAAARKAVGGDLCNIVLPNEKGDLFFAAVDGWPAALVGYQLPSESHASTTWSERRPTYVANFSTEWRFKPPAIAAEFNIVSGLGVPMFRGDEVIGAMLVHTKSAREFTAAETEYLQTLANQTAIGIAEYGEFAGGKRAGDRLRAVSAVSEALIGSTATDLKSLLSDLLMQATQHVTDARGKKAVLATMQIYDEAEKELTFVAAYPPDMYPSLVARIGERRNIGDGRPPDQTIGVTGRCALNGKPELVPNVKRDPDYAVFHRKTKSEIVVPLIAGGKVKGVLNLESDREGAFSSEDLSTLEAIAKVGVLALDRLTLRSETHDVKEQLQTFREAFTNSLLAAGHDLRTPLTTIKGNAEMLLKGEFGKLSESALERIRVMLDETNAELRKATNLCDTVIIHEKKFALNRQMRNLSQVARSIAARFASVAERQKTNMETDINPEIIMPVDEKIELVFVNLMDNALKVLRAKGGKVKLTVHATDEGAICSVEDSGCGIPLGEVPRVFERFYSTGTHSGEGLGIGLSVSKYFVEQHNGRLWVDSPKNPTRFSFTIRR